MRFRKYYKQINGFIDYCKVSGFKDKSIKSLSLNLNKLKLFLEKIYTRSIKKVTYRHLLSFVADFEFPSIHTKKACVWALRQFLIIDEYNKILSYCSKKADTRSGIRKEWAL